ncbi:MAG TPA: bluetail domain-containing putative surface protein, partial [Rhizomicrobium sp.]|nr:bluetail domain-containing putative surface protein [Rhizomicrobium sp.]
EGGAAKDTITGGAGDDTITGGGAGDLLAGGGGADTFVYNAVSDSTGTKYDTISNFNATVDKIQFPTVPAHLDTAVTSGSLSTATFNSDLHTDLAGHLAKGDAILFTASAGTLSGHTFLVVDANGSAGYQANADFVVDVTGHTGTFTLSDFA